MVWNQFGHWSEYTLNPIELFSNQVLEFLENFVEKLNKISIYDYKIYLLLMRLT
jgi:hypothetical protein